MKCEPKHPGEWKDIRFLTAPLPPARVGAEELKGRAHARATATPRKELEPDIEVMVCVIR